MEKFGVELPNEAIATIQDSMYEVCAIYHIDDDAVIVRWERDIDMPTGRFTYSSVRHDDEGMAFFYSRGERHYLKDAVLTDCVWGVR